MTEAPTPVAARLDALTALLSSRRFNFADEAQLQRQVEHAFSAAGVEHRREVVLSAGERIDFIVGAEPPYVGVELKIQGGLSEVTRQVHRYLRHEELGAVLVVCTRMRLGALPSEMRGKPVRVVVLVGSML